MPSQPESFSEARFVFIGGPALVHRTGSIRTRLLQQVHRDRKAQQRRQAAAEIEALLEGKAESRCTCASMSTTGSLLLLRASTFKEHRQIRPKAPDTRFKGYEPLCPICNKTLPQQHQVPSHQIWDIGSGSFDPMIPRNEEFSRLNVQENLHFACVKIWPGCRPLGFAAECYKSWIVPFRQDIYLYAILWSSSYYRGVLSLSHGCTQTPHNAREQYRLKGLALSSLRKEVDSITPAKRIDSIILCMLYLAVNDEDPERMYRDPSPINPPFTYIQSLDIYGSREYHPLHWQIIQYLIQRHGGIEVLHLFAASWLVSVSDIMNAAHTLEKPVFPCMGVYNQELVLEPPLKLFEPFHPPFSLETAGSGFSELLLLRLPVCKEHVAAFASIGQFSCVLQYYATRSHDPHVLECLGDCRNFVHHRLFSLPDENDPTEVILQYTDGNADAIAKTLALYSTCRLALRLYATHVTYPLPRSASIRGRLLPRLSRQIQDLADEAVSSPVFLWCVSVTLIISDYDSSLHLEPIFRTLLCGLEISDLDRLLQLLRTFAWVDIAMEHQYSKISKIVNSQ